MFKTWQTISNYQNIWVSGFQSVCNMLVFSKYFNTCLKKIQSMQELALYYILTLLSVFLYICEIIWTPQL